MITINEFLDNYFERFLTGKDKIPFKDKVINQIYNPLYYMKNSKFNFHLKKNFYKKSDILVPFFSYRSDHELLIYPVLKELSQRGFNITLIIPRNACNSINLIPLKDSINIITFESLYSSRFLYLKVQKMYENELKKQEEEYIKKGFNKFYIKKTFLKYAYDYLIAQEVIKELKPQLVYSIQLVLNPGWLTVLKENKIKLHLIQHGFFNGNEHDFIGCDLVYLWGDYHKSRLKLLDNNLKSLVVGNPKMQHIKSLFNEKQEKEGKNLTALVVSSAESFDELEMIEKTIKFLKHEGISIIYKLHPSEKKRKYKKWLNEKLVLPNEINNQKMIYPLMEESDIVIGGYSTAVNEAAYLGKLVIRIDYTNSLNMIEDGIKKITSLHELKGIIKGIKESKDKEKYLVKQNKKISHYLFNGEFDAATLIAKSIKDKLEMTQIKELTQINKMNGY
ncbi:hypothetical protein ELQ35_18460 [Peribacillus cavernae]|uniref:Uncharacterized protein n=1 Tax=Peribacillus cavernae TaxID=1674310 RepID=A0A3S0VJC6_9BACI|nr:UDP-N-acetylglucosamine 2-epimerase [Peribacillus cavernae]MDQ0221220.1 UDP-N-acetylglucosamine:LPS N-acetylglucosamine transferase [Peribacillus cavernae]RUQ26563.1 hypothetical protein ELQ35_18460 [Peribacillus cavernae]